jgi:hypothetical protein
MSNWKEFKSNMQATKARIDTQYLRDKDNKESMLKNAFSRYVKGAGINKDSDYTEIQNNLRWFDQVLSLYQSINKRISEIIKEMTSDTNLKGKLSEVGQLQEDVIKKELELKRVKEEAETSYTRHKQVENPTSDQSFYQGFGASIGFKRPLHLHSIPFLIGFGIFILFLSGLLLRDFFSPSLGSITNIASYQQSGIGDFFTDSRFYSVAAGGVFVFVVIGILAYAGRLGSTIN